LGEKMNKQLVAIVGWIAIGVFLFSMGIGCIVVALFFYGV